MAPRGHAAGQVEVTDVLHTGLEDGVPGGELVVLGEVLLHLLDELADLVHRAGRQVLGESAGADVRVVHPQARDELVDVENHFTITESVDHDRGGAELHAAGGDAHQVGGHPVQLHQEHPDDLRPLGDLLLDAEEFLDGETVGGLVEEGRQVVHARHERGALRPRAVLEVLLDPGVEVADAAAGLGDRLAVDLQDETEHSVRGGCWGPMLTTMRSSSALAADWTTSSQSPPVTVYTVPSVVSRAEAAEADADCVLTSTTSAGPEPGSGRPCTRRRCRRGGSPCAAGGPASRPAS